MQVVEKKMVGDTGFRPVTSTVGAQKEETSKRIGDFPCKLSRVRRFGSPSFLMFLRIFLYS
jgi:hypothetical protein